MNSKVQLAGLERIHQRSLAQQLPEGGMTLADPAHISVRGKLICGRDAVIDVNCVFEGDATLTDGMRIGAHTVTRDAVIGAGAEILSFYRTECVKVGAGSCIGPYARLRPDTGLVEDVHVGNFVEVKNSQTAAHSKANHLAYVGDATVGSRVSIGTSTIAYNYDGANRSRTATEDDAFIGSDTRLVTPVRVDKGTTLGVGTTLTKDAPEGKLAVSRARQVIIDSWQRPIKQKKEG